MPLIARITFLLLVGATFAAFFVAQRLKSEPPVINVPAITQYFSPNGDGRRDVSKIAVSIKVADEATVDVVNLDGDRVRRLVDSAPMRPNRWRRVSWDGKADDGRLVPDGQYRLRVALRDEGRSAIVQKTMTVDTKAPQPTVCIGDPCGRRNARLENIVSQGDREIDLYVKGVSPNYQTIFRVFRTDRGAPEHVETLYRAGGFNRRRWDGLVDGRPLDPGVYLIQAQVRDRAGNRGLSPAEFEPGTVRGRPGLTVRGIAAQPPVRPVSAGGRTEFFVDARGAQYRWRVRRVGEGRIVKRGTAQDASLVFRAPQGPSGVYLLELRAGRWSTTVPFLVQATERAKVLVVVPTLTWIGADKIDDAPLFDGLPNTLTTGDRVRWPRMYAGEKGLPEGFASDVAPLLVFLDRRRIRYDLTSDIDLDLTRNPRATDREGVLLAGSMTWVTRSLGRRLRKYVEDGGKLAVFGTDTLRRGVRLRVRDTDDSGTLERPTQPAAADPFGTRFARARRLGAPTALSQYDDSDPDLGLMEGALELPGFTRLEESTSIGSGKLLAAVGQPLTPEEEAEAARTGQPARELRPALAAVRLGKGTLIRVGLPEWAQRLQDPNVAQVTRNLYDILRGVQPRIRSEG